MKKLIMTLTLFLISINVYAKSSCSMEQIEAANKVMPDLSYTLTYDEEYYDMNGDTEVGYFKIQFKNIPADYYIKIDTNDGAVLLTEKITDADLNGGVYKISLHSRYCKDPVRTYEMRVPFYKQYCEVSGKCNENVWYDGTTADKKAQNDTPTKANVSTVLLIILIVLLLVTVTIVVALFVVRRKRKYEEI